MSKIFAHNPATSRPIAPHVSPWSASASTVAAFVNSIMGAVVGFILA